MSRTTRTIIPRASIFGRSRIGVRLRLGVRKHREVLGREFLEARDLLMRGFPLFKEHEIVV